MLSQAITITAIVLALARFWSLPIGAVALSRQRSRPSRRYRRLLCNPGDHNLSPVDSRRERKSLAPINFSRSRTRIYAGPRLSRFLIVVIAVLLCSASTIAGAGESPHGGPVGIERPPLSRTGQFAILNIVNGEPRSLGHPMARSTRPRAPGERFMCSVARSCGRRRRSRSLPNTASVATGA